MKYKTYRWVLGLFLALMFGTIVLFLNFNLRDNLGRIKESYLREYKFLTNSITKDLLVLEAKKYTMDQAVETCCEGYGIRYANQDIYLRFYKGGNCIYSTITDKGKIHISKADKDKTSIVTQIVNIDKLKYIRIYGYLPDQYSDYAVVYYGDITKIVDKWIGNIYSTLIAAGIFAVILSICLRILIEHLFKPLERISFISRRIAQGDYNEKLDIKGEGEIAEVVDSFNTMADTIRKQIQKLEDNAADKQMLIDNLAHELRTPLTAIYGYAEYIQKANLTEEDKYVSTQFILHESKRLKTISEMLLNLAALREETELKMDNINVKQLFERLHQIENTKLREKDIHFSCTYKITDIYGNEELIESMLINLIDNAIKACDKSQSSITVGAYKDNENKVIEVADNGKGMSKKHIKHVTEAFYRVDKSRSRDEGGNGLGLALCQAIADKHHARLIIESVEGEGTKIKIVFCQTE